MDKLDRPETAAADRAAATRLLSMFEDSVERQEEARDRVWEAFGSVFNYVFVDAIFRFTFRVVYLLMFGFRYYLL